MQLVFQQSVFSKIVTQGSVVEIALSTCILHRVLLSEMFLFVVTMNLLRPFCLRTKQTPTGKTHKNE